MGEFLETRLGNLGEEIVQKVKTAFTVEHINPKKNWESMPYLKDDLVLNILDKIGNKSLYSNLYSAVNKDVLKRVYYGILSTGKLPKEFLNQLTNWEKIFLFRGRWSERKPEFSDSIDVFTIKHMYLGLNKLYEDHFKRKARGEYTRRIKFPEGNRIRQDYKRIVKTKKTSEITLQQLKLF